MIDTRLGIELARARQNHRTATLLCQGAPTPEIRRYWERERRTRRARFTKLAERLADRLIEEKYHGMEGP